MALAGAPRRTFRPPGHGQPRSPLGRAVAAVARLAGGTLRRRRRRDLRG